MTTLAGFTENAKYAMRSAYGRWGLSFALLGLLGSCGDKGSDPKPGGEPVDPPRNVVLRLTADSESAIIFSRVKNADIPENNAQGLGYIYDVKFTQNGFKAATSVQPPGQLGSTINEPYTMTLYEDNIKDNGSKTKCEVIDAQQKVALIKPGDGSFGTYSQNGKTMNVSAIEVYATESGIAVNDLNFNTVKEAISNAKFNFATGKYPRTINVTNPAGLSVARIGE